MRVLPPIVPASGPQNGASELTYSEIVEGLGTRTELAPLQGVLAAVTRTTRKRKPCEWIAITDVTDL